MTAWELQLCANAAQRAAISSSWMTAAFYRTKKLEPLDEMLAPYDSFKLGRRGGEASVVRRHFPDDVGDVEGARSQ